jgi:hypothetical protein
MAVFPLPMPLFTDRRYLPWLIYLVLAWTFANLYDYVLPHNLDVTLDQLVSFTARRPMQLRVLVPAIIRGLHEITTIRIDTLSKLCTLVSTWAVLVLFARFLEYFVPKTLSLVAAPLILIPLLWNYCLLAFTHYPSDLPAIAFFIATLLLWKERKWVALYALFTLSCFNRETAVFAIPFAVVWLWPVMKKEAFIPAIALAAIAISVRLFLGWLFRSAPGGALENHLSDNLWVLTHGWWSGQGVLRYFLFLFGGTHLIAFILWKCLPSTLRWMLLVTLLVWAVMLPLGILLESRVYAELIPIYCASTIVAGIRLFRLNNPTDRSVLFPATLPKSNQAASVMVATSSDRAA